VVFGSNLLDGWTWTIVQTKAPLKIEAVKAAIDPEAKAKTVKGREYFTTQNNEVFKMLGAYLSEQLKQYNTPFPERPPGRLMGFLLLNEPPLTLADASQIDRFLKQGARWREQSVLSIPAPDPNTPNAPNMPIPGAGKPMADSRQMADAEPLQK